MEEITEEPVHVVARVCAIDIGKAGLVACVRVPHASRPDRRVQEVREYATVASALLALADWLRVAVRPNRARRARAARSVGGLRGDLATHLVHVQVPDRVDHLGEGLRWESAGLGEDQ